MKVVLFANTAWFMYNFNRPLAHALVALGHDVVLLTPPDQHAVRLREHGFRWVAAPMERRSLNPLREFRLIIWLIRFLKRERVDLIHCFTLKCAVYGSLAARLVRVPARINLIAGMGYVFTSTDFRAKALRPLVRCLIRSALTGSNSRLILLNADDAHLFIRDRLAAHTILRLIPGAGVDCTRFVPGLRAHSRPLRVLLPGRLLWDKGIAEFVEAARQIHAKNTNVQFLIAGGPDPGNPASIPESILRQWMDDGLIEWLGHVDDMPATLMCVDIVVLPSYREGLPTCLTEAASCGLPLVATDVPGCRDVVLDGVNGYLVPVRNASALADAILRLVESPELRQRLGRASRIRALSEFDQNIVLDRTMAVYRELAPHM